MGTDSPTVALRRSHLIAAQIEHDFEVARSRIGLKADPAILSGANRAPPEPSPVAVSMAASHTSSEPEGATLGQVYDSYMRDPTRDWSPRTRLAYETTRRVVVEVLGENTLVRSITRARCRELIDTLRWLPRNARKLYPDLDATEVAAKSKKAVRGCRATASAVNSPSPPWSA